MIEIRNDSSIPLMIRIVHTRLDNTYVDIENADTPATYEEYNELMEEGWVIVKPNDYYHNIQIKEEKL